MQSGGAVIIEVEQLLGEPVEREPHLVETVGQLFIDAAQFAPARRRVRRDELIIRPPDLLVEGEIGRAALTAPLWTWYDQLRPLLWRHGEQFPDNGPAQRQLLNDGEIDMMISFSPGEAAVAQAAKQLPAARFLIIGDGPRRETIWQSAQKLGLAERTMLLGSRDDVPRLLAAMDLFALTSHIEANPVSILEAMSVGRPVVATNVGSIHEAVAEEPVGQPRGVAQQILDRHVAAGIDQLQRPGAGGDSQAERIHFDEITAPVNLPGIGEEVQPGEIRNRP